MEELTLAKQKSHNNALLGNYKIKKTDGELLEIESIPFNNFDVLVECDGNRPYFGIYYGIRLHHGAEEIPLTHLSQIKEDFLSQYWLPSHIGKTKIEGERIFLEGEVGNSEDGTYWQFWIRLEDSQDVSYAINGVRVISDTLKRLGYK